MIIESLRIKSEVSIDVWPFYLAPVRQLIKSGLSFNNPITFLVGENGTGKSTIVEAIAEAYGLDMRGGHGGRKYGSASRHKSPLGETMTLDMSHLGNRMKLKRSQGFFLRSETALSVFEHMSNYGVEGYGSKHLGKVSHGEGYIQVLQGRFNRQGLYLLDEPEAALSFSAQLVLMKHLQELVANGSQVICATHSPILSATPGSAIFELNDNGIYEASWKELQLTQHWQRFMAKPEFFTE